MFKRKYRNYFKSSSTSYLYKKMMIDSPSVYFGWLPSQSDIESYPQRLSQTREKLPWICSDCSLSFKWDVLLLRHQRKTGHNSQDRNKRRERRYKRVETKIIRCSFCSQEFENPRKRLDHARWCEGDERTLKTRELYRSSFQQFPYECSFHSEPHYFSSLQRLQQHIKSHRQFDEKKIEAIRKIFAWRKKWNWAGFTNDQYQRIAKKNEIHLSFSKMRRIFKKA